MTTKSLRIIPLGGLGEVGKNMLALEYSDSIVVIDAGVLFPDEDMPGVDLVLPDITYLKERQSKVKAILITHGHEDHIGALPFVLRDLNVPVYASRLSLGLISVKLKEYRGLKDIDLRGIEPGQTLQIGPFGVEFFRVCHSIPDAMGIAINTPLGSVIHTGDFKVDHTPVDGQATDFAAIARLASGRVLALLSDSTYAELPGYTPSEQVVGETLDRVIGEAHGRVMIATFASLISRIQQVLDAASKHDRHVAVIGRSMSENVKMALKMGYLVSPDGLIVTPKELNELPREKSIIVMTGSQGEPTSALVKVATGQHREVSIVTGDTVVISASPIPGNEVVVTRTIDNLMRNGARVLYSRIADVHVHGHASQEELKMILNLVKPKFFIPVHGEYHHLSAHADIARAVGIDGSHIFVLQDGDVLELDEEKGVIVEQVPAGHVYVDGRKIYIKGSVLNDRLALSRDGIVVVAMTIDEKSGRVIKTPEVFSRGFVDIPESMGLLEATANLAMNSVNDSSVALERNDIKIMVAEILRSFLLKETGRRPLIVSLPVFV